MRSCGSSASRAEGETPDELARSARQEGNEQWLGGRCQASRRVGAGTTDPATAAERWPRGGREAQVRAFYDGGGFLSQPAAAPLHHRGDPRLSRTAALFGVATTSRRAPPRHDGVPHTRRRCRLPYFYAPMPGHRAGIATKGPLPAAGAGNAHDNPVRRRYYDSGPKRGSPSTRGVPAAGGAVRDAPHTRAVIWNFARLRSLRVEADAARCRDDDASRLSTSRPRVRWTARLP